MFSSILLQDILTRRSCFSIKKTSELIIPLSFLDFGVTKIIKNFGPANHNNLWLYKQLNQYQIIIIMKLKTLLETHSWSAISSKVLEIYPDANHNLGFYEEMFEKLRVMESDEIDISIVISTGIDDDHEYIDVSGVNISPKNKEEEYPQGLELTPWKKWLGMEVDQQSLNDYSKVEIVAHCLYEMTYMGFSEDDIPKTLDKIDRKRKEEKLRSVQEKDETTAEVKEYIKKWSEEINNINTDY